MYLAEEQEQLRETAMALGYTVCRADIDNSGNPLDGTRRVNALYQSLSEYSSDVCVYLGGTEENMTGLPVMMSRLQNGGRRVIGYRESLR